MNPQNGGKIMKSWRNHLGFTQHEWVKELQNVLNSNTPSISSVKSWEVSRAVPSSRFLRAAAKVAGVDLQRFMQGPDLEYATNSGPHDMLGSQSSQDFCIYRKDDGSLTLGVTREQRPQNIVAYVKIEISQMLSRVL